MEGILERKEQQKQINDESAIACNVMLFFKYVTVISYGPYGSLLSMFPLQDLWAEQTTQTALPPVDAAEAGPPRPAHRNR